VIQLAAALSKRSALGEESGSDMYRYFWPLYCLPSQEESGARWEVNLPVCPQNGRPIARRPPQCSCTPKSFVGAGRCVRIARIIWHLAHVRRSEVGKRGRVHIPSFIGEKPRPAKWSRLAIEQQNEARCRAAGRGHAFRKTSIFGLGDASRSRTEGTSDGVADGRPGPRFRSRRCPTRHIMIILRLMATM
jgi:hypothetical protein